MKETRASAASIANGASRRSGSRRCGDPRGEPRMITRRTNGYIAGGDRDWERQARHCRTAVGGCARGWSNWEEAGWRGWPASGILHISVAAANADALASALRALTVTVSPSSSRAVPSAGGHVPYVRLELVGNDHPDHPRHFEGACTAPREHRGAGNRRLRRADDWRATVRARAAEMPAAVTTERLRGRLEALAGS